MVARANASVEFRIAAAFDTLPLSNSGLTLLGSANDWVFTAAA
jgi:hypothetical protein